MRKVFYLSIIFLLNGFVAKGQQLNLNQYDGQLSFYFGGVDRPSTSKFMSNRDTLNTYDLGISLNGYFSRKISDNQVQLYLLSGLQFRYGYLGIFAESYLRELGINSFQDQYLGEINPSYFEASIPIGIRLNYLKIYVQLEILNNIHLWKSRSLIFDGSHTPIRNRDVREVIEDHYSTYFRRFYNSSSLQLAYYLDSNVTMGYHTTITLSNRFRDLENDKYSFSFGFFINYTFN